MKWNPMVPELSVSDLARSQDFYVHLIGFTVCFERAEPPFVYLCLGEAQLMLEQDHDEAWVVAPVSAPRGRGLNLQIEVDDVRAVRERLVAAAVPLFRDLAVEHYETIEGSTAQHELLVQDLDGYLLRLVQTD